METIPTVPVAANHWTKLKYEMFGEVILPEDNGYQQARLAWNLSVDQNPAVIVIPAHSDDVITAVRFAAKNGLGLAIQSTGHGIVRPANGAMLMLTAAMQDVRINAAAQTAWVEAGVRWGKVLQKAQAFGLAPLLGSSPEVGAIGYTLGGGFGWLGRKYGLAIDSINYFEVVTATGHRLIASEEVNPDLFWGLRGGGGSLGIVTGMAIRLYPVAQVYAGNLFYPAEMAEDVFRHYRSWIAGVPDELTSSVLVMNYPPIPDIPEFLRGQSFAIVRGCYCGALEEGTALVDQWREWQAPLFDDFKPIPFSQAATVSSDPVDPLPGFTTGAWLQQLSDQAIEAIVTYALGEGGPSPLVFAEVRHAGGAVARSGQDTAVYGNRESELLLCLVGVTPDAQAHQQLVAYTDRLKDALRPSLTGGVYMNFLEGVESQQRIRDGLVPGGYEQLARLKAQYDPHNLLAYSFNIPPAG